MADTHQDGAGSGADFDLSQFYQIFFEEASENLDQMEQMLLSLDLSAADDEELNGIFRCAHSIKGGGGNLWLLRRDRADAPHGVLAGPPASP